MGRLPVDSVSKHALALRRVTVMRPSHAIFRKHLGDVV